MAFLAVTSLMRSLEFQFLHPQPRVTLSNKKQIKSLHEKLGDLLVFLDNFEKNGDNHPEMRAVTERIIAVSVKAEDDIEEELLTDHHHHNCLTAMNRLDCCCLDFIRGFSTSVLQLTASFCPTKLEKTLQRVVDEVEKLVQITMNTTHLSNTNLTVGGSSTSQHTSPVDEEDAMVGHWKELDEVLNQLLGDRNEPLQVMAIVGMGGIDKTTFAERIYDHPRVKSHFDLRAWTTMSREHNKGQAILDLCRCFMPLSSAFNNEMEEDDLKEHLYRSLLGHRYLIIVDDIWTTDAWDDIHRCFPDNNNGSKILLTTRTIQIAQYAGSSGVPQDITDLVFLRYLALDSCMLLNHIPLDKKWNLQTLIISEEGDDKDAHKLLPHGIWNNLQQLRHLEINHKLQVSIDLLKVQENLQTLYWLSISQCTAEVFMRIPNVKELGIVAGGHKVSRQGLHYLCFLNYLEKLRFQGSDQPLHLPPFYIFPQTLKELTFVSTRIPWKAMSIISMLPNLEVLKLKKFACTGPVWELTEDRCFPQLKVLIISLTDLKYWMADVEYPFPNLERLKLKKCFELEVKPYCFAQVMTLQLIKLVNCPASLVCYANEIKEDQYVLGNDMLDVVDFHT